MTRLAFHIIVKPRWTLLLASRPPDETRLGHGAGTTDAESMIRNISAVCVAMNALAG